MGDSNGDLQRRNVLTISLSRFLTGHPIQQVLGKDWQKAPEEAPRFNNTGFDFDGNDTPTALGDLKHVLHKGSWDGILVGWCLRGNPERTVLFEQVVALCTMAIASNPQTKLMFSTGPDNLVETTLRNFN